MITLTYFEKSGGPLTKRIALGQDGNSVISDGSACVMAHGTARRFRAPDLPSFAKIIGALDAHEAIALGAMRSDLRDQAEVITKRRLTEMNGAAAPPQCIARTAEFISYEPQQPALALLDFDSRAMPPSVASRITECGGFWPSVVAVLPELAAVARVSRASTSAGLFNQQTGAKLPGSNGLHVFLLVQDGADVERFLKSLHARCWLAGFGWLMVGAGGQLLERSIVDRMVGAPERLVFEGAPVLAPPLAQDAASREPIVTPGTTLDTIAACPPLTIAEQARLRDMLGKEAHRLAPAIARAREAFIGRQSQQLAARTGMPAARAAHIIVRQCSGILLPDVVLPFDDEELHGSTVADVLADPGKYEGATLADPLEGPEYGRCKAKIMRRADGTPWINSFAHGRTIYQLRYDATAIAAALDKATPEEVAELFATLAVNADLAKDELENLRDRVAKTVGVGKRAIDGRLKAKHREHAQQESTDNENRRAAERLDPRPRIPAPEPDAPWLPQMQALNDVLGHSTDLEPPARDIDGVMVQVRVRRIPNMHALTQDGANDEEPEETRLPAPEQPLLSRMSEPQLAEMIERNIDYFAKDDRPVHLAGPFVHHFHSRTDDALPLLAAVSTLPLVLGDGTILAKRGLDRDRGIVFRVPPELLAILPQKEDCTPQAVGEAMQFLADDWLCDVATTYEGKCTIIASSLSVIERSLLDNRPVFFISAGRRGGGKTTVLVMALVAATGIRPAAAAWSTNEEERRKALLAYLLEAVPSIIWDNIPRGAQLACPHIERSCTTEFYSDRRLGVSELVATAASAIQFFTGNNIAPRGDLASRALRVRLEVDRHDPENRDFRHPDPIGWTEANRGKILRALYTIMLGNPALRPGSNVAPVTRFKRWWRLVGSAVEHAAQQHAEQYNGQHPDHHAGTQSKPQSAVYDGCSDADSDIDGNTDTAGKGPLPKPISFQDLFLAQEEEEEDGADLGDALDALEAQWPDEKPFKAADVAVMVNDTSEYRPKGSDVLREFLFPKLPSGHTVTPKAVGNQLKRHEGNPVKHGDRTLILKSGRLDTHGGANAAFDYWVKVMQEQERRSG